MQIDELLLFNKVLAETDILILGKYNTSEVLHYVVKDTDATLIRYC